MLIRQTSGQTSRTRLPVFILLLGLLPTLLGPGILVPSAQAVEHVLFREAKFEKKIFGNIIEEDSAGSMLLETDEGGQWLLMADTIIERSSDSQTLQPLTKKQLGKRLLDEMGPGFQLHESKHYVIVYNTTSTYAKWCSSLLERLQKGFLAFWKKRGAELHAPKAPLAVLIFKNKASYLKHAQAELGPSAGNAIGYYSLQTNRIVMYDLTGSQAMRRANTRTGRKSDISALLRTPQAVPLVATIIHEATHQISFNCGLQRRYVDNPIWISEGMAVYFETPNLSRGRLWSGPDKVNYSRWNLFLANVRNGKAANLKTLIATDKRLRHPRTAVDGYAEAWAWNYFLIKWHPKEYSKYLAHIAAKPLLVMDTPTQRIADFQKHFGKSIKALEAEFFRRMDKI